MLRAGLFIPILALARPMPILRTKVPPMSLACAPKLCPTRNRTGMWSAWPPGLLGQWRAALALAVDPAGQLQDAQLCLRLPGPAGRIRANARAGVAAHRQVMHRPALLQGGIKTGHAIGALAMQAAASHARAAEV